MAGTGQQTPGIGSPTRKDMTVAWAFATALLVFQLTPLLWGKPFYNDWINHVWMVEHYADHLRHEVSFPTTIAVEQAFGNPAPSFYGIFFYPLLALPGAVLGGDLAVRLMCAALLVVPLASFALVFRRFGADRLTALLLSVAVNGCVYQLTNLYARSALTEFVAGQLLLLSVSLVFYGLTRKSKIAHAAISFGFACGALAFGSHPITFYTFSLFIAPFLVLGVLSLKRIVLGWSFFRAIGWAALAFMLLLPWIVLTVKYGPDLQINTTNIMAGTLYYFPLSIDSLWGKIGLFFIDPRSLADGMEATSTPFLDAPLGVGLIVALGGAFWLLAQKDKRELGRLAIPFGVSILPLIIALFRPSGAVPGFWVDSFYAGAKDGPLYQLLVPIQFIYRLSGTFWLCASVVLLASIAALYRQGGTAPALQSFAFAGALLAVVCTGQKLNATYSEFLKYPAERTAQLIREGKPIEWQRVLLMTRADYKKIVDDSNKYPFTFYGANDYTMPKLYPTAAKDLPQPVTELRVSKYDETYTFSCAAECLVHTNIVPSKFHLIAIDGVEIREAMIAADGKIQFLSGAGDHTLNAERAGNLVNYVALSVWLTLIWVLASGVVFIGFVAEKYRSRPASAGAA